MSRARRTAALLALGAAFAVPVSAHAQTAEPAPAPPDFAELLLADDGVTSAVKRALREGTARAVPRAFGDLTGDGKSDAVVLVEVPGAAGGVAAYVLSADGAGEEGELAVVYRNQSLYRAFAKVSRNALVLLAPDYARGDDVCCPTARLERTYAWDRRARILRRISSRRLTR